MKAEDMVYSKAQGGRLSQYYGADTVLKSVHGAKRIRHRKCNSYSNIRCVQNDKKEQKLWIFAKCAWDDGQRDHKNKSSRRKSAILPRGKVRGANVYSWTNSCTSRVE